jgi:hypothetical protein
VQRASSRAVLAFLKMEKLKYQTTQENDSHDHKMPIVYPGGGHDILFANIPARVGNYVLFN